MSEFTYLFRGRDRSGSPEQLNSHFEKWVAWFKELEDKGYLTNPGNGLGEGGKVVKGKQKTLIDGPYAEAKDIVAGYIVIEAKNLEHAVEISRDCPIFEVGGSVEVRPIER
jgi:hypothetical protein